MARTRCYQKGKLISEDFSLDQVSEHLAKPGAVVWIARYRDAHGNHRYAKPSWNGHKGSFARKADAQAAIDEALGRLYAGGVTEPETVGAYFAVAIHAAYGRHRR